ncbi:hypothetical protein EOM75_14830, partial [Candidatus Falkowbacteria bacterium]|nr:hypothetical protein [Candidatus Falkowbacteria bacterium]
MGIEDVCVGVFNVNGLGWDSGKGVMMPKWEYICEFVRSCSLCGLNETRGSNVGRLMECLPDYSVFSECDRRDKGGQGIALLVRNSIRAQVTFWRASDEIQLLWVRVQGRVFGLSGEVMVGVVYIPPITNVRGEEELAQSYYTLMCEIQEAKSVCDHVFVMGDLNAHVGRMNESHSVWREMASTFPGNFQSRLCTTRSDSMNHGGRLLMEVLDHTALLISTGRGRGDTGQPTCKEVTRTEHFVMTASLCNVFQRVETPAYPAHEFDHSPIRIVFPSHVGAEGVECEHKERHVCDHSCVREWRLEWKEEKRQEYATAIEGNTELTSQFETAVSEGKVELAAGLLMSVIHGAATELSVGMVRTLQCGKKWQGRPTRIMKYPEWFDQGCREARRALKQALHSNEALHLYRARKREYRQLLRRAQRRHTKYRQALFLDRLARLDTDAIKMLRKKSPRKESPIATNVWREYIAKHFGAPTVPAAAGASQPPTSGATHGSGGGEEGGGGATTAAGTMFEMPSEERMCALAEKYARKLKVDTASGFDGLLAPFVKRAVLKWGRTKDEQRHVLAPLLGKLFYLMMSKGVAPDAWKTARLSPIHKKGDVCDPNNYRMIAVNGVLYRVYANVLRELLTEWSVATGAVPDTQFAFYPGRSAQQPMFILRHLIHSTKHRRSGRGQHLFATFVDFTQAYDHIDRG